MNPKLATKAVIRTGLNRLLAPPVAMVYDGDGNRVARTEGGTTHRYLIDDQTPTGYVLAAKNSMSTTNHALGR